MVRYHHTTHMRMLSLETYKGRCHQRSAPHHLISLTTPGTGQRLIRQLWLCPTSASPRCTSVQSPPCSLSPSSHGRGVSYRPDCISRGLHQTPSFSERIAGNQQQSNAPQPHRHDHNRQFFDWLQRSIYHNACTSEPSPCLGASTILPSTTTGADC